MCYSKQWWKWCLSEKLSGEQKPNVEQTRKWQKKSSYVLLHTPTWACNRDCDSNVSATDPLNLLLYVKTEGKTFRNKVLHEPKIPNSMEFSLLSGGFPMQAIWILNIVLICVLLNTTQEQSASHATPKKPTEFPSILFLDPLI